MRHRCTVCNKCASANEMPNEGKQCYRRRVISGRAALGPAFLDPLLPGGPRRRFSPEHAFSSACVKHNASSSSLSLLEPASFRKEERRAIRTRKDPRRGFGMQERSLWVSSNDPPFEGLLPTVTFVLTRLLPESRMCDILCKIFNLPI